GDEIDRFQFHCRASGSRSRRRRVALSQDNAKQKRRWLKRILGVGASTALWLAPTLLPMVVTTAGAVPAYGQAAGAVAAGAPKVNAALVLGWLAHAEVRACANDIDGAAYSFASALRA